MSSFTDLARHLLRARRRSGTTATMLVGATAAGMLDIRLLAGSPAPPPSDADGITASSPLVELRDDVHVPTLVGWRAPSAWRVALLLTEARIRPAGSASSPEAIGVVAGPHLPPRVVTARQVLRCHPAPLTDALARVVGATTPPARLPVSAIAHAVWLHRLLEITADHPAPGTICWPQVARRHPACPPTAPAPAELADAAGGFDHGVGWCRLARSLHESALALPPATISWFDQGSYGRWLLHRLPEPSEAFGDLSCLLAPDVVRSVARVLHGPDASPGGSTPPG